VHCLVVLAAEQDEVVEISWALVVPVDDVVGSTPARVDPAFGECAVLIAEVKGDALLLRRGPHRLTAPEPAWAGAGRISHLAS